MDYATAVETVFRYLTPKAAGEDGKVDAETVRQITAAAEMFHKIAAIGDSFAAIEQRVAVLNDRVAALEEGKVKVS